MQGGRAGHGKECLKWKCLAVCVCARPCGHCVIKGFNQRLIERPSSLSSSKSWTAKNTLAIHRKHNKERVRHMCAKCIDCRQRPQCIMGMYYSMCVHYVLLGKYCYTPQLVDREGYSVMAAV